MSDRAAAHHGDPDAHEDQGQSLTADNGVYRAGGVTFHADTLLKMDDAGVWRVDPSRPNTIVPRHPLEQASV